MKLLVVLTVLVCVLVLLLFALHRRKKSTKRKKRALMAMEPFSQPVPWIAFYNNEKSAWLKLRVEPGTEMKKLDFNDRYNSVHLISAGTVSVRDRETYNSGGKEVTLRGINSTHHLDSDDLNNKLSSVRIEGQGGDNPNLYVRLKGLNGGNNDHPSQLDVMHADMLNWNDKIDKVQVHGNIGITVYEKDELKGWSMNVVPEDGLRTLPSDRRGRVSSFNVYHVAPPPSPPPPPVATAPGAPPPPPPPPRVVSWVALYNDGQKAWFKFVVTPGMQVKKMDFDNKYNAVQLLGASTSVTVRDKHKDAGNDGKEKTLPGTSGSTFYMADHNLENRLSSVIIDGQNGARTDLTVKLKGLKSNEVDYPSEIEVMEADMLSWNDKVDKVEVHGDVDVTFYERDNFQGWNVKVDGGAGQTTLVSNRRSRISSFKVFSKASGQSDSAGGGSQGTGDLLQETNFEGPDWVEFRAEDDNDARIRFRPTTNIEHLNMNDTYNKVILRGSARAVSVCKKDKKDVRNTANDCVVVRDTNTAGVEVFGGDHDISSASVIEPPDNPGAYVTLTGKRTSGRDQQPASVDVFYADKMNWDDTITHVSIKGNTSVQLWKDRQYRGDSKSFQNSQIDTSVPRDHRKKYGAFKVLAHNEGQASKPEDLTEEIRDTELDWLELRDEEDKDARIRFRPTSIGHLAMDDTYNRVTLRGNTTKVRVCERDCKDVSNVEDHCEDIIDKNPDGVEIFDGDYKLSAVKILEPADDPNAYVTLSGKDKGKRMQPNSIDVFHADKLDWSDKATHVSIKGKATMTLYTDREMKGDSNVFVNTQNNRSIPNARRRKHDSLFVDYSEPIGLVSELEQGSGQEQVDNPYVELQDMRGTVERFRFAPVSMDNMDLDDTYNTIILKGTTQKVVVCHANWDQIDEWQTDSRCTAITDTDPSGVKIFEGRFILSSLRIVEPVNDPEAYVTMTGRNPDKTDRPTSIDVYHADKLHWDKQTGAVLIAGQMKLNFFDTAGGGGNAVPQVFTQSNPELEDDRRYKFRRMMVVETQSLPVPPGMENMETDTRVIEDNLETLNNIVDITLVDRDQVHGQDQIARFMFRNQIADLDLNDMYNTITLSENVTKVLVCRKDKNDLLNDSKCYTLRSGRKEINPTNTGCCELITPVIGVGGRVVRTKLIFNGEHDLSFVRVLESRDPSRPAFVRLSGRHKDASDNVPAWVDVVHADKMNWKVHLKTVFTHNRSVYMFSDTKYGGSVLDIPRQPGPIPVDPPRKFQSISMFPKVKIDAARIKPAAKFVRVVDRDDRELLFEPSFSDDVKTMVFKTFDLRRKYRKLRLTNGCTKARIGYAVPLENSVEYQTSEIDSTCGAIGDGWANITASEECVSAMDSMGIFYATTTPVENPGAPVGCSIRQGSEDTGDNGNEWYLNNTVADTATTTSSAGSDTYRRMCKKDTFQMETIETILADSTIMDIENEYRGNVVSIQVMNDGADYYMYGSGGVELFDPIDDTVPQSVVIRRATDLGMSETVKIVNTSSWYVTRGEQMQEIPKDRNFYINEVVDMLVVYYLSNPSFVKLKYVPKSGSEAQKGGTDKQEPDVLIFNPPKDIHNLNLKAGNAVVYDRFEWHDGAVEATVSRGVDGRIVKYTREPEATEVVVDGGIGTIEVTGDGGDGFIPGQGYLRLVRRGGSSVTDRPEFLEVRKATRFDWRNLCGREPEIIREEVDEDEDGDNDEKEEEYVTVSGTCRRIVFYDAPYGDTTQGEKGMKRLDFPDMTFEVKVPCSKMASMYTDKQDKLKTAFLKKDNGNPSKREYINFVVDRDMPHLGMHNIYTQFKFGGGARKVQMCDDRWDKVKYECYTKYGPAKCKKCDTYTWDPRDPDKEFSINKDKLNSLRVYDDGYQGYDKHMGYVEVFGKKGSNPSQPESVRIRNADRMDWNDDPDFVYTPDTPLTFYQHQNKGGDSYHHPVDHNVQRRQSDNYSSMYIHVTQACKDTNQSCMACNDNDAMCRGVYSSKDWRERYFRDEATDARGGFDGKCVDGQCVACASDSDCSYGYQCCLPGSCDKWNTKVYGACHRPH